MQICKMINEKKIAEGLRVDEIVIMYDDSKDPVKFYIYNDIEHDNPDYEIPIAIGHCEDNIFVYKKVVIGPELKRIDMTEKHV